MAPLLDFLNTPFLGTAAWFWLLFLAIVILLLVLDLGVLQRDHHEIGVRESLLLSAGYFSCGLAFGGFVWYEFGATSAMEYYTGFLVEQSLSMDNVFVMAMIFGFFGISDVKFIRAEGLALGAEARSKAIEAAQTEIAGLVA